MIMELLRFGYTEANNVKQFGQGQAQQQVGQLGTITTTWLGLEHKQLRFSKKIAAHLEIRASFILQGLCCHGYKIKHGTM